MIASILKALGPDLIKWLLGSKLGLITTLGLIGGGMYATDTAEPTADFSYYKVLELMGDTKKDILGKRIQGVKNAQSQATEVVKSTYESFKEVTGFQGGDLELKYNKLKRAHEKSKGTADKIRTRVTRTEKVAKEMFTEWETEIDTMGTPDLRLMSKATLRDTDRKYEDLMEKMKQSADKIDPVLDHFGDVVLALKHELNAQAIQSLEFNAAEIAGDVDGLIAEMEASIQEATQFIEALPTDKD